MKATDTAGDTLMGATEPHPYFAQPAVEASTAGSRVVNLYVLHIQISLNWELNLTMFI